MTIHWLDALDPHQRKLVDGVLGSGATFEEAAQAWLDAGAPENTAAFGSRPGLNRYYENFLNELHDLLCGENKYAEQRDAIIGQFKAGQATAVATVTATLSPALSAAPKFLAPAVALTLCAIAKVGLQAWCNTQSERRHRDASGDSED